jgi:hypothetical protein
MSDGLVKAFAASTSPITLPNNIVSNLIWDNGSGIIVSAVRAILPQVQIATIGVNSDDIVELVKEPQLNRRETEILEGLAGIFPVVVETGLEVTPDPDVTLPRDIIMSDGIYRQNVVTLQSISQINSRLIPLVRYYKVGGVWTTSTDQQVDLTQYQLGDNLASVPSNRSSFIVLLEIDEPSTGTHKIGMVYADSIYLSAIEATEAAESIVTSGFTNLPPGLEYNALSTAYVFAGQSTTLDPAGSPTWIDIRQRAGTGGGGAGSGDMLQGDQIFILRINGNDGFNGKNWDRAFLTLSAAISAASALFPTRCTILCQDSGAFSIGTEILRSNTSLCMQNAETTGIFTIDSGASFVCRKHTGGIYLGSGGTSSDIAIIKAQSLGNGASNRIFTDGSSVGNLDIEIGKGLVTGANVFFFNKASTNIYLKVNEIELFGNNGIGLNLATGTCVLSCGNINKDASATTSTEILIGATATLQLNLLRNNNAHNPYTITAGGILKIKKPRLSTGKVLVNKARVEVTSRITGTNLFVPSSSIPTTSDGFQVMNLIYPGAQNANNELEIEVCTMITAASGTNWLSTALFRDTNPNALSARANYMTTTNGAKTTTYTTSITAGTTNPIEFKVHIGSRDAGTCALNSGGGIQFFGAASMSYISVKEYAAPIDM